MPNTVGSMIADSDLKDLGVHTEMYVDAFVDIALAGKINGSQKEHRPFPLDLAFGAGTKKNVRLPERQPRADERPGGLYQRYPFDCRAGSFHFHQQRREPGLVWPGQCRVRRHKADQRRRRAA